jgi:hypothetical protein
VKNYRQVKASRRHYFLKAPGTKKNSPEEVINFIITDVKDKKMKFF